LLGLVTGHFVTSVTQSLKNDPLNVEVIVRY